MTLVEYYVGLLALEYWQLPNATAETTLLAEEWQSINELYTMFESEFDLNIAYGDRLKKIASLVGQPTVIPEGAVKNYFAFSGVPNGRTFGEGPMIIALRDSGKTPTELNDCQLRAFIEARIAKNTASAVMVSDDRIALQDAVQLLFTERAYVTNNFDMTITFYIDYDVPGDELNLLLAADLLPTPQGVGSTYMRYKEGATFGFNNINPNAVGFGQGRFAKGVHI